MAAKAKGALDEWLATKKVETRLLGEVERYILTRPRDTSRRQDVLHPSELVKSDFCPRAAYLRLLGYSFKEDRPNMRLQSIFDEGHAIHAKWQGYLSDMGVLFGMWRTGRLQPMWGISGDMNLHSAKYLEVPLHDDSLRIAGHADGWVKGLGEDFFIEIKSIGTGTIRFEQPALLKSGDLFSAWREIRRPFPTHVRQGQLYLTLAHRMVEKGLLESAPGEIVFLYELKADQSVKEFVVAYDPFLAKDALDDAYDIVAAIDALVEPDCRFPDSCKSCALVETE
jgi:CRISPR/Cas system-associated exonuclease Cas4 (RecB family)